MTSCTVPPPHRLPSHEDQSRVFHWLRWRTFRARLAQGLATSRLRYALVVSLSVMLWGGLFYLVEQGFAFMKMNLPLYAHDLILRGIFNSFFLALFLMLVFSSSVILYGSLFRGREVAYLFTLPIHEERVFQHQFQHAVLLSSWGFVLLGSPMLVAYGIVSEAPWYYYAILLPMLVAFVYIPAGIGSILLLAIMYLFPRKRMHVLGLAACAAAAALVWFFWALVARPESELLTPRWFADVLHRLQMTQARPLPNWWLSEGLLDTAAGKWSQGVLFLALLIANALFLRELAGMTAARLYRSAYWAMAGMGRRAARVRMGWFDRGLSSALRFLDPQVRLILMKDLRLFRRDPLQWSQFLILVGLLVFYFMYGGGSSRKFTQWVNIVSFMNLAVVGLLMSTFTTRFVFPMVSLEGRNFWLLGLLPLKRDTILWAKFLFSVGSLLAPCGLLVLLSDWRLEVPGMLVAQHQATSLMLCLGLSGIGVGLGARLPLLNEHSPSRIAAGFGGTLNLVISTIFIVLVLVLMAMPYHIWLAGEIEPTIAASGWMGIHQAVGPWLLRCTFSAVLASAVAALVPMWIGIRTFRRQEFYCEHGL